MQYVDDGIGPGCCMAAGTLLVVFGCFAAATTIIGAVAGAAMIFAGVVLVVAGVTMLAK